MDEIKRQVALAAANLILDNSIVGLGTGSTANFFIEALSKRCLKGLNITAVASSKPSLDLAKKNNIKTLNLSDVKHIDVYVDGADEVDKDKNMIKGRGAALLKEKILSCFSKKVIIIIDESKKVKKLGKVLLPIEITTFGSNLTKMTLEKLGYVGEFRKDNDKLFITENKNLILDVKLPHLLDDPKKHQETLLYVPGVVETGLFVEIADEIIIGYRDSEIEIIS